MSFEFLFDNTGIIDGKPRESVADDIKRFKEVLIDYKGDAHEPRHFKLVWGENSIFKGRVTEVSITLQAVQQQRHADPRGRQGQVQEQHRRAKARREGGQEVPGPDPRAQGEAGDTLPQLCFEIYGDPKYYLAGGGGEWADNFRQLTPGTNLDLPADREDEPAVVSNASTIPTPATPDVCTVALLVDGKDVSGELHVLSICGQPRAQPHSDGHRSRSRTAKPRRRRFAVSNSEHFLPGKKIEIQLGYRSQNETVFKGTDRQAAHQGAQERQRAERRMPRRSGENDQRQQEPLFHRQERQRHHGGAPRRACAVQGRRSDHAGAEGGRAVRLHRLGFSALPRRSQRAGRAGRGRQGQGGEAGDLPASPVLQIAYGSTVLELDAEIDARWQSKGIKASSWNAADQAIVDADAKEPSTPAAGNLAATDLAKVLGDDTQRDQARRRARASRNCRPGPTRACCACVWPRFAAGRDARASPASCPTRSWRSPASANASKESCTSRACATASPAATGKPMCSSA